MKNTNYLRLHRKKWALSQSQTAHLIGVRARSTISDYEYAHRLPSLSPAVAFQFVFGESLRSLFPAAVAEIEEDVIRRAVAIEEAYRDRTDAAAETFRELLGEMLGRADSHPYA